MTPCRGADLIPLPPVLHQGPDSRAVTLCLWASKQVAVLVFGIRHKSHRQMSRSLSSSSSAPHPCESEGGVRTTERPAATPGWRGGPACPAHPAVAVTLDRKLAGVLWSGEWRKISPQFPGYPYPSPSATVFAVASQQSPVAR